MLGYRLCAVILFASQRTHGTTFRALKVTFQVTTPGAESAVCDCLVVSVRKRAPNTLRADSINTQGDSVVISMPDGFRGHLVGKTLVNVFQCDIAEFIQHDKSSSYV